MRMVPDSQADASKKYASFQDASLIIDLENKLAAANALLARVFGSGCVFTGSRLGPIDDCACADANGGTCDLLNEHIPLDGTRHEFCPYLALEKE